MKIQTKYHGEIEVHKTDIWHFQNGLPGFPDEKQFVQLPLDENNIFHILQSIQTPYVGFVNVNPFNYLPTYNFKIDDQTLDQLGLEDEKDVLVFSILNVKKPFSKTTANLQAPLIFNIRNRQAKQMVLNDSVYHTKHLLFLKEQVKG
ncbi:flagellar assembly protein FliW [Heyndrickxia ginsengihumi]|uniref:flagellar assembly protein FliW n=1 Tax=Heyndrickxia ginsengihumi TaxID=363870 RepID=UPI00203DE71C|nr:flagellar assembly protein FliW [Heyndrickxia ginsengihumi]MCM3024045.1 flagellar assembly protein FliW [Heyndrickxia ginsengihumi]